MTNTEPDVKACGRYTIKETCALLGISRSSLRNYTIAGMITVNHHKANLRPFYKGSSIISFWRATTI